MAATKEKALLATTKGKTKHLTLKTDVQELSNMGDGQGIAFHVSTKHTQKYTYNKIKMHL